MAVNFFWGSINRILAELNIAIDVSCHNMDFVQKLGLNHEAVQNDPKLADALQQSEEQAKWLEKACEKYLAPLKCDHIDASAKAVGRWIGKSAADWASYNSLSIALRNATERELKNYHYYQYPKAKGEKFSKWKADWEAAITAFPEIERDVFHATDLYALGKNTASVFYSMRVAEHGLRALAKERKVRLPRNKQIEWATWQEILKALDAEITAIGGTKAGKAKDSALEFYSGARADLNGFKDEYRNLVMHVRATYDEHQAIRALSNVNSYMTRIAAKIDHNHYRIRWGLRR
jgi:hypothetical protein